MLSLVLPTFNEAGNVERMIEETEKALSGVPHEIIIVDDNSPDGTWKIAQEIAAKQEHVHVLRRMDKRGLSSAVIDGFLVAKGDVLMVMDADGQHDSGLLHSLYDEVMKGTDIAIGSRYIEGGSVGNWDERRYALSRLATRMALSLCKVRVKDPMSGFFAINRKTFEKALPLLNPKGFKILLDFLVHVPKETKAKELPLSFGVRTAGESKLSRRVQIEFLEYLYDVTLGKYIPLVFVKYCIVGALGVIVHLTAYLLASRLLFTSSEHALFGFSLSVITATETAIIFNFLLNNVWTFSNSRLHGVAALRGFLTFNVACAFGALANLAVSSFLFRLQWHELLSVTIGAFVGVIWNYTMNKIFTWRA